MKLLTCILQYICLCVNRIVHTVPISVFRQFHKEQCIDLYRYTSKVLFASCRTDEDTLSAIIDVVMRHDGAPLHTYNTVQLSAKTTKWQMHYILKHCVST